MLKTALVRQALLTLLSLLFGSVRGTAAPAEPRTHESTPWYLALRPGVTRSEIERFLGTALGPGDKVEQPGGSLGRFEFEFRDNVLQRALHYDPAGGFGGLGSQLYSTHGTATAAQVKARREFLQSGAYADTPHSMGGVIRTRKYDGSCYEVDGQYLVIEPIVEQGMGHFARKTARVLLVGADGAEKTLYRASDHWRHLKPPNVSETAVIQREAALRRLGTRAIGRSVEDVLGPADSQMGSGIDYRVYYLPGGLAVVMVGSGPRRAPLQMGGPRPDAILQIDFSRPGSGAPRMTFEEWLRSP
jgi:hypothetical protein